MPWVLATSAFAAAALAFLVEPLVARLLLPTYGGSSAVWTTALVFFQVALLAGYAWAHVGSSRLGVRRHAAAQVALCVVALATLPIVLPAWAGPPVAVPAALWLVASLTVMVGLPFFVLGSNTPTVQRWLSLERARPTGDPYRLFAASNAGSLVGLIGYPTIVAPRLDLADQTRWWTVGFAGFTLLTVAGAMLARRSPAWGSARDVAGQPATSPARRLGARRRARWLALAAVPAALLVGVTGHLSTDVAAVPLLWVVPLSVYLVTLILAYAGPRPLFAVPAGLATVPLALVAALSLAGFVRPSLEAEFAIHLGTLLAAGLALHGALAADRPPPAQLTDYTLVVAAGGALGGLAAAVIGPLVLPVPLEEHVAIVAAVALAVPSRLTARVADAPRVARARLARGIPAVIVAAVLVAGQATEPRALVTARSFYGTYRVVDDGHGRHVLYAGTTVHGIQDRSPGAEHEPWSYYSRNGPLGQVLASLTASPARLRIGAVGLGTGAIAAYGRPGDRIDFLEIDPVVVEIARDPRLFTYLSGSQAEVGVSIGDGRLLLESIEDGAFDIVVLDAFSSDSVPVHLLTVEGLDVAMRRVRPGGVLAIHISNRYLDLEPVVAAAARALGLVSIVGSTLTPAEELGRSQASQWVVIARSYADLAGLVSGTDWRTAHAAGRPPWTDRWSDILGALRPG